MKKKPDPKWAWGGKNDHTEKYRHYQEELQEKYGKEWPKFALERYVEVKELIQVHHVKDFNLDREYDILREWLIAVVYAGIDARKELTFV